MTDPRKALDPIVRQALLDHFKDIEVEPGSAVRAAPQQHGDYQVSLPMALAKTLRLPPRKIAETLVEPVEACPLVASVTIAGPGFVNIVLRDQAVEQSLLELLGDERLGIVPVEAPQRIVVDYSSPNVAKEMHIGHLRSTVIGDAICRFLEAAGHHVIRQNHIGDWGTQFGLVVEYLFEQRAQSRPVRVDDVAQLHNLYVEAKARFDTEPAFAEKARRRVVALQQGDPATLKAWQDLVDCSVRHMNEVYDQMGIGLADEHLRGESFYNPMLQAVEADLRKLGLLVSSEGAEVVYPKGFLNRDGEPLAIIVRKRDGGFGYASTDLAAARYRVEKLRADRIVYVHDARQADHFAMVFAVLREAGWADGVELNHVPFGVILGQDKKPFRSRDGGTVPLLSVIDEAVRRARDILEAKGVSDAELLDDVSRKVAVASVKYADLSSDRIKDYVFDYDRMLAFEGNTAPYLLNAYVRLRAVLNKARAAGEASDASTVSLNQPEERILGLHILRFPSAVEAVLHKLEPHHMCAYLYDLAVYTHRFYERCHVLREPDETVRKGRLALCELVTRTLSRGLQLLGLPVLEKM